MGKLAALTLAMQTVTAVAQLPANLALAQSQATETFTLHGSTRYDASKLLGFAAQVVIQRTDRVTAEHLAATVETMCREDGYFLASAKVGSDGRSLGRQLWVRVCRTSPKRNRCRSRRHDLRQRSECRQRIMGF